MDAETTEEPTTPNMAPSKVPQNRKTKPTTMPGIIKFMNEKTRGILRKERSDEIALTSPRSLEDAEEMMFQPRRTSVFAFDSISPSPIDANGDLRHFKDEIDPTDAPTERDYDFDYDSYCQQQQPAPPTAPDMNRSHPSILRQRSQSAQRPLQGNGRRRRSSTRSSLGRRAASVGRTERRRVSTKATEVPHDLHDSGLTSKKKKSKMEKILQLQEKNQRYKDEFRRVQKDRKSLKRELENKKLEAAALAKEVDSHGAESTMLKMKLSEALQQLDKVEVNERRDRDIIAKLKGELAHTKGDYNAALARLARMREEIDGLKVAANRKDQQLTTLAGEVADQRDTIESLEAKINIMKTREHQSIPPKVLNEKESEIDGLKLELSTTLQRASTMVKEREEAISDLLRENEDMKTRLGNETKDHEAVDEEVASLRAELEETAKSLEQSQDRTVALEEEVEAWMSKNQEIDSELARLRLENEEYQQNQMASENVLSVAEASARDSAKKATQLEAELLHTEKRHREEVEELQRKHTESILDQKEKIQKLMAETESENPLNPQEMMLQKAVADRKAKEGNGSWGSVIQRVRGEPKDNMTPEARRIKELEALLASQEEDLMKAKSDMVRMKTSYNDTMYMSKKRIEDLEKANRALKEQVGSCGEQSDTENGAAFPDLLAKEPRQE